MPGFRPLLPEPPICTTIRGVVETGELVNRNVQVSQNPHNRPIASHSERVFVRAKLLVPVAPKPHQSCAGSVTLTERRSGFGCNGS